MTKNIYKDWAENYLAAGFNPVAIKKGKKVPANSDWNKHVPDLPSEEYVRGLTQVHGDGNIGLATGVGLSTNRIFAAIDSDVSGFVPFLKKVINPISTKFGSKGITIFCQAEPGLKSAKFKTKGKKDYAAELLIDTGMTVIPPSIHPNGNEYVWQGKSLLDLKHEDLPVLDSVRYEIIRYVATNEHAWEIVEGGAEVQGHELMLKLTSSGIALLTEDLGFLADCLNALFHENYKGNTKEETLGMLRSAKEKGMGAAIRCGHGYNPGEVGPVPLGYLDDGRYVFLDQVRSLLLVETSSRLVTEGALINMAPSRFWMEQFPKISKGQVVGINCYEAADALLEACRAKGGFDTARVRGRGVYLDAKGGIVINWGDKPPEDTKYIYVCHLPLEHNEKGVTANPKEVLDFFRLFCWSNPSEAYLLLGWTALAVICGVLDWRPHIFISGPKNAGKTTLILALMSILEPIGIGLDGQSTEAGIRQKLGPDSRPMILDEFESDQNVGRMKSVVKLIRSSSSAKYSIARGTPEGKALEFCIRSSFLLGAINPFMVTAADRSRIVVLSLKKHSNSKEIGNQIASMKQSFDEVGPSWCKMVIANVHYILSAIKTLQRVFPSCESRHALNMASLFAGAWVMLHQREMTEKDAEEVIAEHKDLINSLAEAHEEDDAIECLNALLGYQTKEMSIGVIMATIKNESKSNIDFQGLKTTLEDHGIRWEGNGFLVANSHPGIRKIFQNTLWAEGAWVSALSRVDGAEKRKQLRFSGGVRSLCIWIPEKHITEDYVKEEGKPF